MTTKRRCPKCNQLNDTTALACVHCGAELIRICPNCGAPRPWNVPRCPNCQVGADDTALFTDLFRQSRTGVLHKRYVLQDTLHAGPVGTVYRAFDVNDRQRVYAVKELSPESLFRSEERREAEAAVARAIGRWAAVDHPGLARIVDHFVDHDRQYVVSEFVPGWSGERILAEPAVRIPPDLVRNWGAQISDLLEHLHSLAEPLYAPFLAPGHVMVTPEGVVKLVGYGLGYHIRPTAYGPYGSSAGYGAPELARQGPDRKSDVLSLGRLLYALLIDRRLDRGVPRGLNLQQAVPGISPQLVRVIARAATGRREQRFASAADLRQGLWEDVRGALEPVADWYQMARIDTADTAEQRGRAPSGTASGSMEDMGFARDPRFGPRPAPGRAVPVAAPSPATVRAPAARLSVQPTRLSVADLPAHGVKRVVLTVRNAGEGEAGFRTVSQVDWLRVPSRQVTLAPQQQARVILSLDADKLRADSVSEERALAIETESGRQWVPVSVQVQTAPALRIDPETLVFGQIEDGADRTVTLTVHNDGRQRLDGLIAVRVPWLQVQPAEFRVPPGSSMPVNVRVSAERLPDGPQSVAEALRMDSNGGQITIAASAWRPKPRLVLAAGSLDFGRIAVDQLATSSLILRNEGDGELRGTARSLLPWLQVEPGTFAFDAGTECRLTVSVDATGFSDGPLQVPQALRLQTNGGAATLSARMQVSAPRMVIESPWLDLGSVMHGERARRTLVISNAGSAALDAVLTSTVDWIRLSEAAVSCAAGATCRVEIEADTASFERGIRLEMPGALRVASGSDVTSVGVSITVLRPALVVEPQALDFGYLDPATPATQTLTLRNEGTGDLAWHAQSDADWVEVQPDSGRCGEGKECFVTLTAYALALEAGADHATGTLAITSDAGRVKVPLSVALADPRLAVDRTFVDLGVSVNRQDRTASVRLFNRGLGLLRGTVKSDRLWLVMDRASFECDTGHSVELGIHTDLEELPEVLNEDRGVIVIESNGGSVEIDARIQTEFRPVLEEPTPVLLKRADPGDAAQGRLILRNTGMATAHVRVTVPGPHLAISRDVLEVKASKSVRVSVTLQGQKPENDADMLLDVVSGDDHWLVPVQM